MTLYLGLDLSWTATALVAIHEDGSLSDCTIVGSEKKDFACRQARLAWMRDQIAEWLSLYASFCPGNAVAIEGYSMGSSYNREMLAELGGTVRLWLWENAISFIDVPPTTLKAFVTSKGTSAKEVMLRDVYKRWGYDADDNNDADAYALARYAQEASQVDQTAAFKKLLAKTPVIQPAGV